MIPRFASVAIVSAVVALLVSFVLAGSRVVSNREDIARQRVEDARQCHYLKVQNRILIGQLEGALVRVRASLPNPNDPIRKQQVRVLTEGIEDLRDLKC